MHSVLLSGLKSPKTQEDVPEKYQDNIEQLTRVNHVLLNLLKESWERDNI